MGTLAAPTCLYGLAFGIMAAAVGMSPLEAGLMSALLNAGGAQMASLQAWADPVPVLAVCLTTLAMNARYLLLGARLRPLWEGLPAPKAYGSLFVLGDGNWALYLREHAAGRTDAAFILGSGLSLWVLWVVFTVIGNVFGALIEEPRRYGLDFMIVAFFACIAAAFVRRVGDLAPLAVAVATAILVERLVEGPWYIVTGAVAGSAVGALRPVGK